MAKKNNGIDHAMTAASGGGIGKGKVGEPEHEPGKIGVDIRLTLFFDGTLNNRTNTNKRLNQTTILDGDKKGDTSSYANFYSNVAIGEYMNLHNRPGKHEASIYVEGIGTIGFSEEDKQKGIPDVLNGNDNQQGYAFGSGPTGIRDKVTKGINLAKETILNKKIYIQRDEFIRTIIVDVLGFSRGSAASRHFVSRRDELRGPWPKQGSPEIRINFVGIFETVSSFDEGGQDNWGVAGNVVQGITEGLFDDDVKQLHLHMEGVPKRVIHLTAADEHRKNFSLTTIDTSLKAGVGFELQLPGVHSDIGGGYIEPGAKGDLNKEVRRIKSAAEKQQLIAEGWYTDGSDGAKNQFEPAYSKNTPTVSAKKIDMFGKFQFETPAIRSYQMTLWENGVRYLNNQYQYIPLYLMLGLATQQIAPGPHLKLEFESFEQPNNIRYKVPADLVAIREYFVAFAHDHIGSHKREAVGCKTFAETRWLRNRYLHRSARAISEGKAYLGMDSTSDDIRTIIRDDKLVDKPSIRAKDYMVDKAQTMEKKLDAVSQGLSDMQKRMRSLFP